MEWILKAAGKKEEVVLNLPLVAIGVGIGLLIGNILDSSGIVYERGGLFLNGVYIWRNRLISWDIS